MDLQVELQVNYYSLLLLFAVSLTVHLVINRLTVICQTILRVTRLMVTANSVHGDLVKEISALQKELSALNPVDDFAKHAKLQRRILAKQSALKDAVGQEKKKSLHRNMKFPLYIMLRVILEIIILSVVWHCSQQPVLIAPENWFHPLDKLLYPLWNRGTVGSLFWMMSCRQAFRQFSNSGYLL